MEKEKKSYEKKKESADSDKLQDFERELGERLYDSLDIVLPSMQFRLGSNRWISKVHIDGTSSADEATCVYEDNPSWLKDWARGNKSLVWAVVDIEKKADNYRDALEYLCRIAGLDMPRLSDNQEAYVDFTRRIAKAQTAYHEALMTDPAPQAKAVRDYLIRRGWSAEDVAVSGLGYVSDETRKLLFTEEEEAEISQDPKNAMYYIGKKFTLAIPVFAGGRIETFKFRDIFTTDKKNRYRGLAGVGKDTLAYIPFRGQADTVIIVEGEMDALHDRSMWTELGDTDKHRSSIPVVATGGGAATPNMIADAIRRGIYYFILAFDDDEHLELHTHSTAKNIHDAGGSAFVLDYPKGYKDLDEMYCDLIDGGNGKKKRRHDIYDIQRMAAEAVTYGEWKATRTLLPVINGKKLTGIEKVKIKRELSNLLAMTPDIDKPQLIKALKEFERNDLDVDSLAAEKLDEAQNKRRMELLRRQADCLAKGNSFGAEKARKELLKLDSAKGEDIGTSTFAPQSVDIFYNETPPVESIETPYELKDSSGECCMKLQSGGITVIAARSGHGKTTFMLNLAIHAIEKAKEGDTVMYFMAECSRRMIVDRLIQIYAAAKDCGHIRAQETVDGWLKDGRLMMFADKQTETVCERIRRVHSQRHVSAAFVDYMQLLKPTTNTLTKKDRMEENCAQLEEMAKETSVAVILGAQLNRADTKDPISMGVDGIADAIDIEQIASQIFLLWNSERKPSDEKMTETINARLQNEGMNMVLGVPGKILVKCCKTRSIDMRIDCRGVFCINIKGAVTADENNKKYKKEQQTFRNV